eukprot:TRINITY_DN8537_c0_g1_i1.p1 TRINITY_DN8537_c0_g1~~TRINITY_DN8537_c0_g1_i1.p1  ORF type:complete len:240 (+),score=15.72 TRINITY_DN8537_c0_g1_i1:37-756(+)
MEKIPSCLEAVEEPDPRLPAFPFLEHLSKNPNYEKKLRKFTRADLQTLDEDGIVIKDNFWGEGKDLMRQEAEKFYQEGLLREAGMGKLKEQRWKDTSVRGDVIIWLNGKKREDCETHAPNLFRIINRIDGLRKELNETCEFESHHTQVQLACYPGSGTFYKTHLDSYAGGTSRRITILYYMNVDWKPEDGGCLRIHRRDGTSIDVEPIADRLLVFQSPRIWHEVLPSHAHRFTLASWFY